MRPTTLYRFYDDQEHLLYVGISLTLPGRWLQHREEKPWWVQIARAGLQHFEAREQAAAAELTAIAAEKPIHNIMGSASRTPSQQTAGSEVVPEATPEPPIGWFCHITSSETGKWTYQGQVLNVWGDRLLVQFFSWLSGEATNIQAVRLADDGSNIRFYDRWDDWLRAGERISGEPGDGIESQEAWQLRSGLPLDPRTGMPAARGR